MSLKKYEAFVRTVELGSLTKAAEAMGSTQSRISHVLSALEEEYGFVLLRPTEEKAALIADYGKDVIQLEQRMAELAAADAARTKKHHERHAAAPEH